MRNIISGMILAIFIFTCIGESYAKGESSSGKSETQILVDMLVEEGVLSKKQGDNFAEKAKKAKRLAEKNAIEDFNPRSKRRMPEGSKGAWNVVETKWNDRLEFETRDGNFKGAIGGSFQTDFMYVRGQSKLTDTIDTDFNRQNDRAIVRRARLYLEGDLYEDFFYHLEYDFNGDINHYTEVDGFRGVYMGMQNIPYIGTITIGQIKEPFSLEEVTGSSNITFVERALPTVFAPGFSWGVMMNNSYFDDRVTFAAGAFRNSESSTNMVMGNEWNITARATALPWYEGDDSLVHIGFSYRFSLPNSRNVPGGLSDKEISYNQRPELETWDNFLDTDDFTVNYENRLGLESAIVFGPFSAQGELIQTWIDEPNGYSKTGYLFGAYGQLSYFITGENRKYDNDQGEFEEVAPNNNFSLKEGTWGAWEIAGRFSHLDLDDKDVDLNGGILNNITFGINWYLNPNMVIKFNYVHSHLIGTGYADGVQGRVQVDF